MSGRRTSLGRRITRAFLATTAFACLLFGLFAFMFAYTVEDQLFADLLADEASRQQAHWRQAGSFVEPRFPYMTLYRDSTAFPEDLRERYSGETRVEIAGTRGRHYHLQRFDLPGGAGPAFAVAEVSGRLVIRPLRDEVLLAFFLSGLALLLLTGLVAFFVARRATAPLTELADRVTGSGPGALPRIATKPGAPHEVAVLAHALDDAFERIGAFVSREAQFTRDASHELRTPLAVIRGAAELIALQPRLEPEIARPLQRIHAAAREMEQTIELLLTLAREEHGRSARQVRPLLPLVEQAVLNASERFDGAAVHVEIDVPASQTVEAAPAALALILNNLVGNAFQHARGQPIRISGDGPALTISDGGPGMAPGIAEHAFEPFAKGEASQGHGLGLSIVKRLCVREGIRLSVTSEPTAGTRVELRFDRPAPAAGAPASEPD